TSSSPFLWYLTRDMALAAYFTLMLTVLFGLSISLARVTGERVIWHIQELHYKFATLTVVLMAGHLITMVLDTYLPFSLAYLYFGCTLAVAALMAARIFISPLPHKGNPPRAIPVSLVIALMIGVIGTSMMFIVVQ